MKIFLFFSPESKKKHENLIPKRIKKIRMGANCEFFEEIQERELLHYHTLFFRLLYFIFPPSKFYRLHNRCGRRKKKNYQDEEKNKKNPIPQVCGFFTLFQLTATTIEPAAPKIF